MSSSPPAPSQGRRSSTAPPALAGGPAISPLREVWAIAWPTVLTMTSYTLKQFIDRLMVGHVGPLEVSAQGNAGIWAFVPIAICLGFLSLVNTFVAQNFGAGKAHVAPRYTWTGLWASGGAWILIMIPLAIALPSIFRTLTDADAVEQYERLLSLQTDYGQILLAGGIVTLSARTMHHHFFGLHRPRIIAVSAIAGNIVNIVANYALIFGALGAPELGLAGAAIGTVLGGFIEALIPFCVFIGPRMNAELNVRAQWRPNRRAFMDLIKFGWPASIQWGNEIICWAIFMTVLVGTFGENHMAAGWITLGYMHLSFMPAVGFSVAIASIAGRYIGAGDPDTAVARTRLCVKMAAVYMSIWGLAFLIVRHPLIELFVQGDATPEQRAEIVAIGGKLLICVAFFQTVDAIGIVYTGALRGAGDTVWPGVMTMILSWVLIVGLGFLMVWYMPSLESIGPWVAAGIYIILFGVTMGLRFESGRWRSLDLIGRDDAEGLTPEPIGPAAAPDVE